MAIRRSLAPGRRGPMNFLNLAPWAVLAGIAALAGLLYLLQRLRIRHAERLIPTTLFWAEAVREAPVRVFRQRFRHWLAYLLLLAICSLLWLGFADPEVGDQRPGDYAVFYLDGSAHSSGGGDFARAKRELVRQLADLPAHRREVIWGGGHNLKLLRAGEDRLLLEKRLEALAPEAAPSGLDEQLRLLAGYGAYPEQVDVLVFGRAPASASALDGLPAGAQVVRALEYAEGGSNRGIVALGVGPARSGAWDRVDAAIRIAAAGELAAGIEDLAVRLVGDANGSLVLRQSDAGDFRVHDLPANGAILEVRINGEDDLPLDDVARLTLPKRRAIRVALSPNLNPSVRRAIAADPGLALSADDPEVAVRNQGENLGGALPALEFAPLAEGRAAFEIGYDGGWDAQRALQGSVAALALDQIDGTGLAAALQRPVGVVLKEAERRNLTLWSELLDGRSNFAGSRSFPLFLSRSLRWLAGEEPWHAYLAAGRPVRDRTARTSLAASGQSAFDLLGADYIPPRGGPVATGLEASLSDSAASRRAGGARLDAPAVSPEASASLGLSVWLMLAALLLLLGEWRLHQGGLIP